jgi:1,4-alpha-glucan branching enzyme
MLRETDNWDRKAHPMKVNDFGVWEITLPAKNGVPVIPHESKVKVPTLRSVLSSFLID